MIALALSLCLAADPSVCVERHLPVAAPASEAACRAEGNARAAAWVAGHPDLTLTGWRCTADAPAAAIAEVAPGVFVHRGRHEVAAPGNAGDLANAGFIVGAKAVAVIDAGGSRAVGEELLAAVRGVTDLPVRWLILTHMHPDHVLGAEVFAEAGAMIVGHARLGRALAARAETYETNLRRLLGAAYAGTRVLLPDEGVEGTREIDLGGRVIELAAHPTAHTDNDLSVFDRQTGTWWVGDLVFAGHAPALDGSIKGWIAVLEAMGGRPASRIVPGHGPASLPWPGGADRTLGYLRALASETRMAIRRGETMNQAIRHLGESQRPGWELFDEFNPRNASAAFQELEWE